VGEDYAPIDLGPWCNAGVEVLADGRLIETGARVLRGLPFQIGPAGEEAKAFLVARPGTDPVVVPVGLNARHVIVAHRRVNDDGESPEIGDVVAEYGFELEDGRTVTVPIRERLEICWAAREGWDAEFAFLAAPASAPDVPNRHEGRWEEIGGRQMMGQHRFLPELFLWSWENPEPEVPIRAVSFRSLGWPVLVAGLTVGNAQEDPLRWDVARPVVFSAGRDVMWEDVDVVVDRGATAYPFALGRADPGELVADPLKGWGEPDRVVPPDSSGIPTRKAYAWITALPSATVTVSAPDGDLGRFGWRRINESGSASDRGLHVEVVEDGRTWVHVTVVDETTGRPIPCRVSFRSRYGIPYQPYGHPEHVNAGLRSWHIDVGGDVRLGGLTYAYIDGACQGWMPVGDVVVDVARGYEYEPIRELIRIERGQRELVLRLRRMASMNARGWYSGDSHVHFVSAQGALTEQQGEDLNVVNLLQSQWGSLFTSTEEFTGRPLAAADGPYLTWVSQENRQHALGHLVLWGLRHRVMPWCTDGLNEAELGGWLEATESEWADRCHQQGGTVVIPHFPQPNGEVAVLIATGRADAVEMITQRARFHDEYYRYLNGGYRLPLVGGTDKMSADVPVGLYRTYARLDDGEPFDHDTWSKAVRAGRTFLTSGPLITFSVEGREAGDTVRISGPGTVAVSAVVESIFPVHALEIVRNGEVVATSEAPDGARRLELESSLRIDADSWIAARCGGRNHFDGERHRDVWERGIFAHTSPVYVACGDGWNRFDERQARYMLALVEAGLGYVHQRAARYPDDRIAHHHGQADHLAYLERPFLEARNRLEESIRSGRLQ
jgi:hypothetical protein